MSWNTLKDLVNAELSQAVEEGRDAKNIETLRSEVVAAEGDETKLRAVWKKILEVPQRADWGFDEPSDLETIRVSQRENRARNRVFVARVLATHSRRAKNAFAKELRLATKRKTFQYTKRLHNRNRSESDLQRD